MDSNEKEIYSHPVHQRMRVGALLAFIGGFLDIYTYLLRGKVFANAQTGNMVLMGAAIAEGDWKNAAYYLIPIFAFAMGVFVTEHLQYHVPESWQLFTLLTEAMILLIVGLCPMSVSNMIINPAISFVCSMQVNSFRKLHDTQYATTMCTGNLRSACGQLYRFLKQHDFKAFENFILYMEIILFFCIGAAIGATLCNVVGVRAVWLCSFLLCVVSVFIIKEKH